MKITALLTIVLFLFTGIKNEIKDLYPTVSAKPSISKVDILKYKEKVKKYQDIDSRFEKEGRGSLTKEEYEFWQMNEFLVEQENPFNTGEIGCSWYCGGGPYKIRSSSYLDSTKTTNYQSKNVHDFNLKTAWATKNGVDEVLTFLFNGSETLSLTTIEFYNGYSKNEEIWKKNSRVKKALLSVNEVEKYYLNLEDTYKKQVFDIGEIYSPNKNEDLVLEIKILEVYPGTHYNDLCVSEINFDGEGDH